MALHLQNIIERNDRGTSDMGSLTFGVDVGGTDDTNQKARFIVRDRRYALSSLRAHFSGGTGTADLVVNVDSGLDQAYDFALLTIENVGTGTDVHYRVHAEDLRHWIFDGRRGDECVLTWTNPDDGNMKWAVTLFFDLIDDEAAL